MADLVIKEDNLTERAKEVGHVFHVNIRLPEATECNDDTCAFFMQL